MLVTGTLAALAALAVRFVAIPAADAAAQPGAWQSHTCADCVATVAAASDAVWVGTFGAGIVRHDVRDGSWRRHGRADGLAGDTVRELAVGPDDDVWAILHVGIGFERRGATVAHFDGARWTTYGAAEAAWLGTLSYVTRITAGPGGTAMMAPDGRRSIEVLHERHRGRP